MTMEFDGGRNLVSRLGAYPDPGWYLGYDVAGAYQRNIEVGIRYIFASSNKKSKLNLLIRLRCFLHEDGVRDCSYIDYFKASAPLTMSISSFVIAACLVLL